MRQMNLKVGAGEILQIGAVGDYVRVKDSAVAVRVESPDLGEYLQMEAGDAVILSRFNRLNISHDDAAEQDVSLLVGDGTRSESSTVHRLVGSIAVDSAGQFTTQTVTVAAGVATQVLPANANRRAIILHSRSGSTNMYYGFDQPGAGLNSVNGFLLPGNGTLILDNFVPTDALWVWCVGTFNVIVSEG